MAAPAEMVVKLAVLLKNGWPLPSPPAPLADTTLPMASATKNTRTSSWNAIST